MNKPKSATASLFLDTRRKTLDKKYPIVIRVTHLRKQFMVSLKMYATKEDYGKALSDGLVLNPRQKLLRDSLIEKRLKAQKVLDGLKVITKDNFTRPFLSEIDLQTQDGMCKLEDHFKMYIQELKEDERIKTAIWYQNCLISIKGYKGNVNLQDIDEDYLSKYEKYMQKRGCSRSTTFMYLRGLRSIFNRAIKKGLLMEKNYPFKNYPIGASHQAKRALMPEQVKQLFNYIPHNESQRYALDYWFFSYLCSGMNMRDIADLRYKDIQGDRMVFERNKTKNTKKDIKPIIVYLHPYAKEIIERQGNKNKNGYVFPILNGYTTAEEQYNRLSDFKRLCNRILNGIGMRLEFESTLNLQVARASFATALKFKGLPIAVISDMLGHSSMQTTSHYLLSIPDKMRMTVSSNLLEFDES